VPREWNQRQYRRWSNAQLGSSSEHGGAGVFSKSTVKAFFRGG